jgi:hypothetical protein
MHAALTSEVGAVAILVRGDVTALRYALLVEHLLPEVRLVVTLFDQTVAEQLVRVVPNCQVISPANVAVPSIIGACVGPPSWPLPPWTESRQWSSQQVTVSKCGNGHNADG